MPFKNVAKRAADLLAGLGDTPEEIAEMLRGAGYKGVVSEGTECPCGACLRDHLGVQIHISQTAAFAYSAALRRRTRAPISTAVHGFVLKFDKSEYPDLIADDDK